MADCSIANWKIVSWQRTCIYVLTSHELVASDLDVSVIQLTIMDTFVFATLNHKELSVHLDWLAAGEPVTGWLG